MARVTPRPRYPDLAEYLFRTKTKQDDFARRIGVSGPTISRIKHGQITPALAVAVRIARAANIPIESLIGTDQRRGAAA